MTFLPRWQAVSARYRPTSGPHGFHGSRPTLCCCLGFFLFPKIHFLCFTVEKVIGLLGWNYMRMSKWWQNLLVFFFSVNYLFSMICISKKYYKILASVYICGWSCATTRFLLRPERTWVQTSQSRPKQQVLWWLHVWGGWVWLLCFFLEGNIM